MSQSPAELSAESDVARAEEHRQAAERSLTSALESNRPAEVQVAEIQAAAERYKADVQREIEALRGANERLIAQLNAETQRRVAADTSVARVDADARRHVAEMNARSEGVKAVFALGAALLTGVIGALGGYLASSDREPEPENQAVASPATSGSEEPGRPEFHRTSPVDEQLLESCLEELESLDQVSKHPQQSVETLRSGIGGVWSACKGLAAN
ncbi:MAG TPA: hypothetical protein VK034_00100 [Enhygromyxa sp.]|nr:hypothetical protein [Enhygromyxa sp.]